MDPKKIKPLTLWASLGILLLTYYPICMALRRALPHFASLGLSLLVQIIAVLLVVWTIEQGFAPIGLGKDTLAHGLKRGVIWSLLFAAAALTTAFLVSLSGMDPLKLIRIRLPVILHERIVFFLVGGLVAPVAEELFFRGVLFGYLRQWGFLNALVMTTVIFVAVHAPSGIPVTQVVGGIVFALSYEVEKSLWTPIIIHSSGNLALFTCSLL